MKPIDDQLIETVDDPWIKAYLRFAQKVEGGLFSTYKEVEEYALDMRRDLPGTEPSMPAKMFITGDVATRFPAEQTLVVPDRGTVAMMTALWVPGS